MSSLFSFKVTARAASVVTLTAATLLAGGVAAAHIPGANNEGVVVVTDSDLVQITVDAKLPNAAQVTGSITNTGALPLRCATPGINPTENPGQVTEAKVVDAAMAYYRANIFAPGGFDVPYGGGLITAGSLYNVLPSSGSLTGSLFGDSVAGLVEIREMQQSARVAGHTGDPRVGSSTVFTLAAGQVSTWIADLSAPATGDRGEWEAGAMFFCSSTGTPGTSFVFAGYEGGADAVTP